VLGSLVAIGIEKVKGGRRVKLKTSPVKQRTSSLPSGDADVEDEQTNGTKSVRKRITNEGGVHHL